MYPDQYAKMNMAQQQSNSLGNAISYGGDVPQLDSLASICPRVFSLVSEVNNASERIASSLGVSYPPPTADTMGKPEQPTLMLFLRNSERQLQMALQRLSEINQHING